MTRDVRWRKFEKVVASIEESLRSRGAVVRSPDRLVDRITGRRREVDATIRVLRPDGTIELTVIECRRRRGRQDDPWIEQLATRKDKLGADRVIAVSSAGFSRSAALSAKHYGIDLKTLDEIVDPLVLGTMFDGYHLSVTVVDYSVHRLALFDADGRELSESELAPELVNSLRQNPLATPLFCNAEGVPTGSLNGVAQKIGDAGVLPGASPIDKTANISFKPKSIFVSTIEGQRELGSVEVVFRFSSQERRLTKSYAASYRDGMGEQSRVLEARGSIGGGETLEMSIVLGPGQSRSRAS